jgi:hypothetical protein
MTHSGSANKGQRQAQQAIGEAAPPVKSPAWLVVADHVVMRAFVRTSLVAAQQQRADLRLDGFGDSQMPKNSLATRVRCRRRLPLTQNSPPCPVCGFAWSPFFTSANHAPHVRQPLLACCSIGWRWRISDGALGNVQRFEVAQVQPSASGCGGHHPGCGSRRGPQAGVIDLKAEHGHFADQLAAAAALTSGGVGGGSGRGYGSLLSPYPPGSTTPSCLRALSALAQRELHDVGVGAKAASQYARYSHADKPLSNPS